MLPTVLAAAVVPCAFCSVDRSCVPMLMPPPSSSYFFALVAASSASSLILSRLYWNQTLRLFPAAIMVPASLTTLKHCR
jgi:hypothetical protein